MNGSTPECCNWNLQDADVVTRDLILEQRRLSPSSCIIRDDRHPCYRHDSLHTDTHVIFPPSLRSRQVAPWVALWEERINELTDMLSACSVRDYPEDDAHLNVEEICRGLASLALSDTWTAPKRPREELTKHVSTLKISDTVVNMDDPIEPDATYFSDVTLVDDAAETPEVPGRACFAIEESPKTLGQDMDVEIDEVQNKSEVWHLVRDNPIYPTSCQSYTRMLIHAHVLEFTHVLPPILSLTTFAVLETLHHVARPDLFTPLSTTPGGLMDVD